MRTTTDHTDVADEVVFMLGRMQERRRNQQRLSASPGSDSDNEKSLLRDPDETARHAVPIEQTCGDPKER